MEADRKLTGQSLKDIRQSRGFSLRQLAAKAGCSAGFLSQIERGQTSPSLEALKQICRALSITVVDLLMMNIEKRGVMILRDSRPAQIVTKWRRASLHHLLPPTESTPYSLLILDLPSRSRTPLRSAKRVMKELGMVLAGKVYFELEGERHELKQGDSIYFDLMSQHRWINSHTEAARVFLINANFTEVQDIR